MTIELTLRNRARSDGITFCRAAAGWGRKARGSLWCVSETFCVYGGVCVYVFVCMCLCVCVCVFTHNPIHSPVHTSTYFYTYSYTHSNAHHYILVWTSIKTYSCKFSIIPNTRLYLLEAPAHSYTPWYIYSNTYCATYGTPLLYI